jgi:phosphoglycolate phosphatase-like HAD superfamily hydrolase
VVGVTHIVWDWNGTLLDDLTLVVEATNASLATLGAGPVTADEHRRDFIRPVQAYYEFVIGRDITDVEFQALDKAFHDTYHAGAPTIALTQGVRELLASYGHGQSLLSMWFHTQLVPAVDRYELTPYFRRVDGLRATVGGGHKAPLLRAHLDGMGLRGEDVMLIGDSVDDAEAAASVGARAVLYSGGFTDVERLRKVGVPVVDTLEQAVALARVTA